MKSLQQFTIFETTQFLLVSNETDNLKWVEYPPKMYSIDASYKLLLNPLNPIHDFPTDRGKGSERGIEGQGGRRNKAFIRKSKTPPCG